MDGTIIWKIIYTRYSYEYTGAAVRYTYQIGALRVTEEGVFFVMMSTNVMPCGSRKRREICRYTAHRVILLFLFNVLPVQWVRTAVT